MWRARPRSPSCQPRDRPRNKKCWPNFPAEPRDHQQPIEHPLELARSRSFRISKRRSVEPPARPAHRWRVVLDLPIRPRVVRAKQFRLLSSCRRAKASSISPGERARPLTADSLTSRCVFYTRRSVIVVLFSACGSHGASSIQRASRRATPVRRERGRVWIVWSSGSRRHSRAGAPRRPCESLSSSCPRLSFLALCSVE